MANRARISIRAIPITISELQLLDVKALDRAMNNILDMCAEGARIDFGVTTQTWKKRPLFHISRNKSGERTVYTIDLIYHFLAGGTKPHEIVATGKSRIRRETIRPKKHRRKYVKAEIIPPIKPVPPPDPGGPRLAFFATGFKPKSRVNKIVSVQGRTANRDFVMPKKVNHPGFEARNFDRIIQKKWQKQLPILTMRAIETEIRRIRVKP